MESVEKLTHVIQRADGSEVKIVAAKGFNIGQVDVVVQRRESPRHAWRVLSNHPHPDWRKMSVDEYIKHGRSEMLQAVSHGEILKVTSSLAATGL